MEVSVVTSCPSSPSRASPSARRALKLCRKGSYHKEWNIINTRWFSSLFRLSLQAFSHIHLYSGCKYHQILTRTLFDRYHCPVRTQSSTMQPPSSVSEIGVDKGTQTIPLCSPYPHTSTTAQATPTDSIQPPSPNAPGACTSNHLQSIGPIMTTLRSTTPGPSTAVTLHQPQSIRHNWTTQKVKELVQLRSQNLPWSQIAANFPGKTANACRKRYERHKKGTLRRGQWLKEAMEGVLLLPQLDLVAIDSLWLGSIGEQGHVPPLTTHTDWDYGFFFIIMYLHVPWTTAGL